MTHRDTIRAALEFYANAGPLDLAQDGLIAGQKICGQRRAKEALTALDAMERAVPFIAKDLELTEEDLKPGNVIRVPLDWPQQKPRPLKELLAEGHEQFFWVMIDYKWRLCANQENWHGFVSICPYNTTLSLKDYGDCPAIAIVKPCPLPSPPMPGADDAKI